MLERIKITVQEEYQVIDAVNDVLKERKISSQQIKSIQESSNDVYQIIIWYWEI